MQAGHRPGTRGARRAKIYRWKRLFSSLSSSLPSSRLWLLTVVLALLIMPAGARIFAQSGFVPFSNSIISLDVSPDDPGIVLAGTLNVPVPAGIYRSTDGGHTWNRANVVLPPDTSVATIRFDPQDGNRALAADGGVGNLFISEDGGLNWRQEVSINQVLTPNSGVGRLFPRIEDGQTVFYAGTRHDGVVRSVDGGLSWEWYGNGLRGNAVRVRSFAEKDGALYAGTHDGVWRLTPGAAEWERVNLPAGIIARGMTVLDGRLFVGAFASGLYLSDDGYNWVQDTSFPAGVVVNDLLASGDQVIVGTSVGLWVQGDLDWTRASVNGAPFTNLVFRLASSPSLAGVTYAGTEQDGVLRTINSGVSFLSSAQITPLDPAEAPGWLTPSPTIAPTRDPDAPPDPPTETPTVIETPTIAPTRDPNASPDPPTETPAETPTVIETPTIAPTRDPNAPPDPPTETPTVIETPPSAPTRDPNAPTETPAETPTVIETPTSAPTRDPDAPTEIPTSSATVTGAPQTPPSETPTDAPTAAEGGDQPPASVTPTLAPASTGDVRESLTKIPPIWIGGAAVFFLLILVASISVARDGARGSEDL